jgi:hypothetical protein
MSVIPPYLFAFGSGFLIELVGAWWVQAVADYRAARSGLLAMVWAVALLVGLEGSLKDVSQAAFWVFGYGVGSSFAVLLSRGKRRKA